MTAYDDLRADIAAQYRNLSNRLQQIARFALDNPDVMALETIAVISERADVQPSAMIRFAKALGFDGFSEMQRVFRSRLVDDAPRYRDRIRALQSSADTSLHTPGGILDHFVEAGVGALQHLREEIAPAKLELAARILKSARAIHVVGQRRSFPTAAYLAYGFSELGLVCHLMDNVGGLFEHQTQHILKGDAVIAVSFPPYAAETLTVVERATRLSVPIIAITDSPLSPFCAHAAATFEIEEAAVRGFRSLSATLCLAVSLVVSTGQVMEADAIPSEPAEAAPQSA